LPFDTNRIFALFRDVAPIDNEDAIPTAKVQTTLAAMFSD
jgi:hypothetical protein